MLREIPTHLIGGPWGRQDQPDPPAAGAEAGGRALGGAGQRVRRDRPGCRAAGHGRRRRGHRRGGGRVPLLRQWRAVPGGARSLVASGTAGPAVHRTLRVGTSAGAVETAAGSSLVRRPGPATPGSGAGCRRAGLRPTAAGGTGTGAGSGRHVAAEQIRNARRDAALRCARAPAGPAVALERARSPGIARSADQRCREGSATTWAACRRRLLSWERCCLPSDRCAPCASRTASSPSAGGWRRRCVSIGPQWTPG